MPNKVTNQGSMAWMDVGMLRPELMLPMTPVISLYPQLICKHPAWSTLII